MREHEVPTHVQAEDRVLLWFTFPQVVAMVVVCALSYGAYRYAPVGPSEVRMAIAVLMGLVGLAAVVGRIGGRRLPLVAADLLKYRLGARVYAGPVSQLVRSEPPAPVEPVKRGRRGRREKKGGRMPFRPHRWFGKPRRSGHSINGNENGSRKARQRKKLPKHFLAVVAAVALAAVATVPEAALADGHEEGGWSSDEIEFQPPPLVEGRRLFVEGLTVSGDRAAVTLRAATDLDIRVRAFGGSEGTTLRFWGSASLDEGERIDYSLPLHSPAPSFTFSWEDALGQAGAVTVESGQIPHPLPEVEGELCGLRITSLGWTSGAVSGVVESECVTRIEHTVELQTVAGHASITETALLDADVTAITGTLSAATGTSTVTVPFVPDGETRFRLSVGAGAAIHDVTVDVHLEASLRIAIPPLTVLTHHPERTEEHTETVSLWRPGASDTASETITVTHDDGTTTEHTVTAHAHVPGRTAHRDVTITIIHPEHVKAEVVERSPITRTRTEFLSLASAAGSDEPFKVMVLPGPEPEEPPAEQTPAEGLRRWFERLGWEWPW